METLRLGSAEVRRRDAALGMLSRWVGRLTVFLRFVFANPLSQRATDRLYFFRPQVLRAVREELKAGADFIKVMAGGGVASETDAIDSVQYSPEEIQAITKTAKQMGNKMVTAHAYTVESIRHAVENGVTGIEHGNLLDEETAKYMAERGVYVGPFRSVLSL